MAINEKATVEVQVNGQQARQELNQLREYATNLSAALAKAYEAGDKKQIKALTKELKYVNSQMKTLQRTGVDIDRVMKNLSTTGPKELRQTLKAINAELSSGRVQRGSEEWERYAKAARKVNDELKKIKEETEGAQQALSEKISSWTTRWWGFYTMASDALNLINSFANSRVQAYAQMDEAMSQVTKYTGMTRDEVNALNEDLKRMDTRTAREQLNALAGDAGRLGIQSRDQVLEFVDAADKINVALGEDLGEDAVKNIGKLAMMFGEDKAMGMRGAMLATGSAVNEVAQSCSAAETFLVDFTARVAGAAHQANISQGDILGFAAAMDENMLREETSATAYQNILMKMYTNTEGFASAAGLELAKFSELLRTDANEALLQFAEGLAKKGGLADLAPLFGDLKTQGAGVSAVLSVMAGKAGEIRERQALANQAYQEGTSILKEFDVQNNTVQAGLDKARKRANDLAVELGERLQPIMAEGLHLTSTVTKVMIALLDFAMKHKTALMAAAGAYLIYNAAIKAHNAYTIVSNGLVKTATTLRILHAAATANLAGNLTGANRILTLFNANLLKSAVGQKAATAAVYLFSAAKALLTGNVKAATVAVRAFWATLNLNPFVLVATAIAAATAGLIAYRKSTTAATKEQKAMLEVKRSMDSIGKKSAGEYEREASRIDLLSKAVHDNNLSLKTRRERLQELKEIIPGYNAELTKEGEIINENTTAIKEYLVQKEKQIKLTAAEDELSDLWKRQREAQNRLAEQEKAEQEALRRLNTAQTTASMQAGRLGTSGTRQLSASLAQAPKTMKTEYDKAAEAVKNTKEELESLETAIGKIQQEVNRRKLEVVNPTKTGNEDDDDDDDDDNGDGDGENTAMEAEEQRHREAMSRLKKDYLKSDAMTSEEYARLAEDLEMRHLERQLQIAGLEPEKRAAIEQKILDARLKIKERCARELEQEEQEAAERAMTEREKHYRMEVEEATRRHYRELTSEEEYRRELSALAGEYYQGILADTRINEEEKARITKEMQQKSLDEEKEIYDKKVSQFSDMKSSVTGMAQEMGEAMAQFFTDEATDFGDFMSNILTIMLDALEKQLIAEQAAAIASVTIKDISTKGLAGLATAAAKIALITAAFETAKAVLGNFYTGGYTGGGEWDEPKGIVHSNEFVANRFAVANPSVRPVLDLIDAAQRSNTVSTLGTADIARVLPAQRQEQTVQLIRQDSPEMMGLLADCSRTIAALNERLKQPIHAVNTISGRNGLKKRLDDYENLLNNKSRH